MMSYNEQQQALWDSIPPPPGPPIAGIVLGLSASLLMIGIVIYAVVWLLPFIIFVAILAMVVKALGR